MNIENFQKKRKHTTTKHVQINWETEHEMIWLCHVRAGFMAFQMEQQHERLEFIDLKYHFNHYIAYNLVWFG